MYDEDLEDIPFWARFGGALLLVLVIALNTVLWVAGIAAVIWIATS